MKATLPLGIGRTLSNSLDSLFFGSTAPNNDGYLSTAWRMLGGSSIRGEDSDSASSKLARQLESGWNYRRAKAEVWRQGKTVRTRAAAFVSAVLAQVGVYVPRDLVIDGLSAYSITWALSRYLEDDRGWTRLGRLDGLRAGDIVFTEDAHCCPGIPHHVFVFMGWHDRAGGLAYVTDNLGSREVRAILGTGPSSDSHHAPANSPAAYALRAPLESQSQRLLRASA